MYLQFLCNFNNLQNYGQTHGVADDMSSGQTLRNFMGRHISKNDDCPQNSYDYQEVCFTDLLENIQSLCLKR